VSSAPAQ
jgi:ketopantoate reductase